MSVQRTATHVPDSTATSHNISFGRGTHVPDDSNATSVLLRDATHVGICPDVRMFAEVAQELRDADNGIDWREVIVSVFVLALLYADAILALPVILEAML